jgi:large subunit ribosomal protein L5
MTTVEAPTPRLKTRYRGEIAPALQERFGYGNPMQIPGLVKIVVNMGVGQAAKDAKLMDGAVRDLQLITGQKPLVQRARKSIAQFKLREGQPIGAKVTLRGDRMWEFLDRLLSLALPRIRDFRGLSDQQFDGNGNYTFGLTEQSMFHEIDPDSIDRPRGMDITVVTTTRRDARSCEHSASRSRRTADGQDRSEEQGGGEAEVQGARLLPLPAVRKGALGVQEVRPVSHLPARDGARRPATGRHEVVLVVRSFDA